MRVFVSRDGRTWSVGFHDGSLESRSDARSGWEAVVFDGAVGQRLVFRPAGWLARAGQQDLQAAFDEAEAIRTRWTPAGG